MGQRGPSVIESLEYHGSRKVVNLLRGPGHDGEGAGGIPVFDWVKWNWPLPGKTTRDKMYSGYSTENGILAPFLKSFLQLASTSDGGILTLFEDKSVKVIPVMLAKDEMQLKPGLLYNSKQGKLIGSTLNLSYNYIKQGEPDRELIKSSMVQEAEVLCLTTADAKFSLPVGVNHLSKGLTSAETLEIIKKEMKQINVCLNHLKLRLVDLENGVLKNCEKCSSSCVSCIRSQAVCNDCIIKGPTLLEPALRPSDYCLEREEKCVKAAVICISQDSESRNKGEQKLLAEEKQEQSDSFTSIISPVPDAVHVAKRKRQSFANWFLIVDEYCINLVQVRELRNDPFLSPKLTPLVPLSAVRNRDCQDVKSILQISRVKVRNVIEQHVTNMTHTVIPEKYRLTDDNKKEVSKNQLVYVWLQWDMFLSVTLE